ncbi:neuromedin-U receptor 2-like [Orbicella faveolata]|uniref:neuromedin-U receptor 2-like n=1 Tax=Orbicella faveolata TaxID=48498 RepID=UPI0009E64252|nr:neuromedin-U receptor 2-like [Orbicella faveolata]
MNRKLESSQSVVREVKGKKIFQQGNMNNSSIGNFEDQSTHCPIASKTITVVISLVSILAIVGNVLVTLAVLMKASLRTSTNYFIVNMAVSDLLSALTNWPLYATEGMLSGKSSIEGSMATFVCKMGMYSRAVSQAVSVLSLVLIVVERFVAIVHPFHATMLTTRLRAGLLLITWIFPLSGGFPYVWFAKIVQDGPQTFCRFSWARLELSIFYTIGFLIFYCVPFIVIIVLYRRIMKSMTQVGPVDETYQENISARNRQQNKTVMKVFISIVTAFFLCWTPLCVYLVFRMAFPSFFTNDLRKLRLHVGLFFYVFPSLSTAVNPIILFVSSSRFSSALREIFGCVNCKPSCYSGRVAPQRELINLQVVQ